MSLEDMDLRPKQNIRRICWCKQRIYTVICTEGAYEVTEMWWGLLANFDRFRMIFACEKLRLVRCLMANYASELQIAYPAYLWSQISLSCLFVSSSWSHKDFWCCRSEMYALAIWKATLICRSCPSSCEVGERWLVAPLGI